MKKFWIGAMGAAGLALAVGGQAHATQYILNVDGCSSGCGLSNYGTVDVTGQGTTTLNFDIELANNVYFNQAGGGSGGHDEVFWNLLGNPTPVTLSGVDAGFGTNASVAIGSHNTGPFGDFDYVVTWGGSPQNNGNLPGGGIKSLTFTVTGTGPLTLDPNLVSGKNIFAAVDVATGCVDGTCASTGRIGATLAGGVPEPTSWALMILGFGGVGAVLRRQRPVSAAATA
jgi:hypothetical protein